MSLSSIWKLIVWLFTSQEPYFFDKTYTCIKTLVSQSWEIPSLNSASLKNSLHILLREMTRLLHYLTWRAVSHDQTPRNSCHSWIRLQYRCEFRILTATRKHYTSLMSATTPTASANNILHINCIWTFTWMRWAKGVCVVYPWPPCELLKNSFAGISVHLHRENIHASKWQRDVSTWLWPLIYRVLEYSRQ